ncbi:MAG: glycosyltransferase family 9 protein [Aurantibacter sp.]
MKILLVQQKMIGDVLVSSLLCEHIKEQLPDPKVHYLIEEHTTPVVARNPFVDKIILFRREYKTDKSKFYRFLKSIRKARYDVVIDVYGKLESNLITYFSKAKIKIAYPKWRSRFLYTHLIPIKSRQPGSTDTTVDDRLALLSPIINEKLDAQKRPKIYLAQTEIDKAKGLLKEQGIDANRPYLMLGVLGSNGSKSYPFEYMAKVIDAIAENTEAVLLFNYIPSQEKEAMVVYELCQPETRKRISLKTFAPDLRSFLALLHLCQCYIGNEGGSVNMAKALKVPTFSIFSPWIDKIGWDTYSDNRNIAVHVSDYFPEEFSKTSKKKLKAGSKKFYKMFEPELFKDKLLQFLKTEIFPHQ